MVQTITKEATRARKLLAALKRCYPDTRCALNYQNEFQLLVSVVLSAQCTDAKVNAVAPALFRRYPDSASLARADVRDVEAVIKSIGLFRSKARNIVGVARAIEENGGAIPRTISELTRFPGVGRKTANVVLSEAHGINEGVAVDTHCGRVARRLGLTEHESPVKVEKDLMSLYPQKDWGLVTDLFIAHGRRICKAPRPLCAECSLKADCPSYRLFCG